MTNINLAYDLFESSKGSNPQLSPVIFLHGFAAGRKSWRNIPVVVAERTNRKVYAYDSRNYGNSDYTEECSLPLLIEDLFYFMDLVKAEKAVLVGHSMGAYVVMNAALQKPERVEMMISEDMFPPPISDQELLFAGDYIKGLAHIISKIPSHVKEENVGKIALEEMYDKTPDEKKKWTPKESLRHFFVPIKKESDGRYAAHYNTKVLFGMTREPRKLQMEPVGTYEGPSIFLYGSNSNIDMSSQEAQTRKHFPKAEFIEFAGACHNIHAEFGEKTIDVILEVLSKYKIP